MTRKLIATGIAVIVSIPLIPVLEKGIGHLTGTDAPMVFPAQGWSLQKQPTRKPVLPEEVAIDLTRSVSVEFDVRGSVAGTLPAGGFIWLAVRPTPDAWRLQGDGRLRNAYQGGDLTSPVFTDADAAGNHFAARGEFGGFYIGFSGEDRVWAGLQSELIPNGIPGRLLHSKAYLQLFAGGANQHTSWRPTITSLSPAAATAGGPSFTLTVNGSGFDKRSIVSWRESDSSAPIVLTGTALASGFDLGVNTSGGITNWLLPEPRPVSPEGLKRACPAANQWCAMFMANGKVLSTFPMPGIDLSAYQTLIVEMSGDPGSAQLDNGTSSLLAEVSKNTIKYKFADEAQLPSTDLYYMRARYYDPSVSRFISQDPISPSLSTANNAGDLQDTPARSLDQQPQRVAKSGWYSLQVGEASVQKRLVELEFVPDSGGAPVRYTLTDSGAGGQEAGLIHLNEPGSVTIRGMNAEPKFRGLEFADFISRAFDITLQKALLTVFLLAEVLPLSAWILMVWRVRSYAYKKISLLPRLERKPARHEVDLMLNFAKWSGVSCYVLWTAKDILAGAGIVFAGG